VIESLLVTFHCVAVPQVRESQSVIMCNNNVKLHHAFWMMLFFTAPFEHKCFETITCVAGTLMTKLKIGIFEYDNLTLI
jgi:hypothetical protein